MINLLPQDYKSRASSYSALYKVATVFLVVAALVIFSGLGLMGYNYYLSAELLEQQNELSNMRVSAKTDLLNDVGLIKARYDYVRTLSKLDHRRLISIIEMTTPTDSQITNIKFADMVNNSINVTLTAKASTRENAILHQQKLLADVENVSSCVVSAMTELDGMISYTLNLNFKNNVQK